MTHTESLMLACCFGVAIGTMIGNLIYILGTVVMAIRDKRKAKKAAKSTQAE